MTKQTIHYPYFGNKVFKNKQDKKTISLKDLYEYFIILLKVLYPILLLLFILLDYFTFTSTFNFQRSTFLDFYLFNINILDSSYLLLIIWLPGIIILLPYLTSYLSTFFPYYLARNKQLSLLKFLKNSNYYIQILILSLLWSFILFFLSWLLFNFLNYCHASWYFFLIGAGILLAFSYYMLFQLINYFLEKNKNFMALYTLAHITSWAIVSSLIATYIINSKDFQFYIAYIDLLVLFSLLFISSFYTEQNNFKDRNQVDLLNNKRFLFAIVSIVGVSIFMFESFLNNSNKNIWTDFNKTASSTNLFLNKYFLSENTVDFNITDNTNKTIHIDTTATYLPVSKEMKLYFIDNNDSNETIVYAVEKKYYKDHYNYILIDTGHIDKYLK